MTMKMSNLLMSGIVCLTTTLTALAEFTGPTETQIEAAAGNPTQLAALLEGASLEQAAHVVKTVIARIAGLDLSSDALVSRITQAMSTTMTSVPTVSHVAFATMLGNEMGSTLAIQNNPAVVSATQGALTTSAGTAGTEVAKAFGDAFDQAKSGSSTSQNTKDSDKVQPPTSTKYPGQD